MKTSPKKYFPIRTKTSCQLKWSWTSLFLDSGVSKTCHRTTEHKLTTENFKNFHNNEKVLEDRKKMLQGEWPEGNHCSHCRLIEENGGVSDRLHMIDIPDLYPEELDEDPQSITVEPTVVEVFLSKLCNLGCLYCNAELSSTINTENKRFDIPINFSPDLKRDFSPTKSNYSNLLTAFWEWFPNGFPKLKRFHILGGEPFLQKEVEIILDYIEEYPNPQCELNIITNLSYPKEKLEYFVARFKKLLSRRKIKRVDITCSIDCWGEEQEYTRYGINLDQWEDNFNYLLEQRYLYLSINQTITTLTVKSMPDLLKKLQEWRKKRPVHHAFCLVVSTDTYTHPTVLPGHIWKEDCKKILDLMPRDTERNNKAWEYMKGSLDTMLNSDGDPEKLKTLVRFLDEKDRRRNTNWRSVYPWLEEFVEQQKDF